MASVTKYLTQYKYVFTEAIYGSPYAPYFDLGNILLDDGLVATCDLEDGVSASAKKVGVYNFGFALTSEELAGLSGIEVGIKHYCVHMDGLETYNFGMNCQAALKSDITAASSVLLTQKVLASKNTTIPLDDEDLTILGGDGDLWGYTDWLPNATGFGLVWHVSINHPGGELPSFAYQQFDYILNSIYIKLYYSVDPFFRAYSDVLSPTEIFYREGLTHETDYSDTLVPIEEFYGDSSTPGMDQGSLDDFLLPIELFSGYLTPTTDTNDTLVPRELFVGTLPKYSDILVPIEDFVAYGPKYGSYSDVLVPIEEFDRKTFNASLVDVLHPVELISSTESVINDPEQYFDVLVETEVFDFVITATRDYSDTLQPVEGFNGWCVDTDCNPGDVLPSGHAGYGLTQVNEFKLEYPVSGTATYTSVTVRAPNLGNTTDASSTRIYRETRGKTIKNFRDDTWPQIEMFHYSFAYLSTAKRDALFDFVQSTLGLEIKITDHESREWVGIITNPNGSSIQELADCGHTFEFDFTGELL